MLQLENKVAIITGASSGIGHAAARGGGSLIFTSTFVGHTQGMSGMEAHAASTAGVIGLTKAPASDASSFSTGTALLADGGVSIVRA
ncbi:hypothetical protein [Janthinobacterium lividum]|uniref:hypothetical protein n=1 Tax=Janthinobacterium TaxID=29580 RepID=UPI0038507FCF